MKRGGEWVNWSYKQYHADSRTVAKAFIKLGLERHHSVGILGFNAPEWFIAQAGAIFAGGLSCGIYTTNSPQVGNSTQMGYLFYLGYLVILEPLGMLVGSIGFFLPT